VSAPAPPPLSMHWNCPGAAPSRTLLPAFFVPIKLSLPHRAPPVTLSPHTSLMNVKMVPPSKEPSSTKSDRLRSPPSSSTNVFPMLARESLRKHSPGFEIESEKPADVALDGDRVRGQPPPGDNVGPPGFGCDQVGFTTPHPDHPACRSRIPHPPTLRIARSTEPPPTQPDH